MLGPRQEAQAALFYEFSLEDHVPQDHLLRSIDRFVDLSDIRQFLAEFYSHTGRPSIDPELLIRMLLVGYCFGIRSERRLCEEVHLNLAYRWFCRLDLSDPIPNHSTFSKNRHGRFRESKLLRHLFEKTVARCIEEGLASGQRMAVDASLIEADANKQNSTPKKEWDASTIDIADARKITREEHEDARQVARDLAKTEEYQIAMKLRKKVEMLFAHLKRILGLGRLRLRGPCGAKDEFLLATTAQNLRKLAKILPAPQQPRKA